MVEGLRWTTMMRDPNRAMIALRAVRCFSAHSRQPLVYAFHLRPFPFPFPFISHIHITSPPPPPTQVLHYSLLVPSNQYPPTHPILRKICLQLSILLYLQLSTPTPRHTYLDRCLITFDRPVRLFQPIGFQSSLRPKTRQPSRHQISLIVSWSLAWLLYVPTSVGQINYAVGQVSYVHKT
jgi:hypothetical protein